MHVSPINLYGITQEKKCSQVLHIYFVFMCLFSFIAHVLHQTCFQHVWTFSCLMRCNKLCIPGPLIYFNKHRIQSTVAFAKTRMLSVARYTSNTSSTAATCLCLASLTSSLAVYSILTALSAPNNGRHPDLISAVQASTNSQIEHTIYSRKNQRDQSKNVQTQNKQIYSFKLTQINTRIGHCIVFVIVFFLPLGTEEIIKFFCHTWRVMHGVELNYWSNRMQVILTVSRC